SGIELAYDDYLSGKDGQSILQRDAKGKIIMPINSTTQQQKSGHNVILTIDNVLQTIAEEELKQAVQQFNARGGNVIISNPNTGEILTMASAPGFDANHATRYQPETWRIRAITDIFEPGSTFKIVTMMSALAGKYKKLNDIIYCENGRFEMFGEQINDAEKHGWLSVKNVFVHSSNIGTAKIAQEIGKENLFVASRKFGFGNKTGIELPGEVTGILKKPSEWSGFTLAAVSYGHEVAVTPLQVAMAYGAIANGGTLMKATIVKEITDQENRFIYKFQPQRIRKVMEPETARELAAIMVDVVEKGTGQSAKIPNIKIAGKTGTAQKPLLNGKGYSTTKFVASFAGFYPAEGPKLLIYVTIDEPYPIHSGGNVAAPAFRNILKRILKLYNLPTDPYLTEAPDESPNLLPELIGRSKETALHVLKDLNIEPQIYGQGEFVQKLRLTTTMDKEENRQIMLTLADYPQESEYTTIPDLKGMSLRKAVSELTRKGLKVKIFGSGRVVSQEPEAGSKSKVGATCVIECEPATKLTTIAKY
ncbi:MAG: penicillin-binding transpeptidase domain-containing protein, partial [bacterium]